MTTYNQNRRVLTMTETNFHAKTTALEVIKGLNVDLNGKVVLITGVTSGKYI